MKPVNSNPSTPLIRCGCGHTLGLHEENLNLAHCRHFKCDCDGWNYSPGNSDAEYVPLPNNKE